MKAFHFRLQKVLEWRRTQLEIEEAQFRRQAAELAAIDAARAALLATGVRAETELRSRAAVDGLDLRALGRFRVHVQARDREIAGRRDACARLLAERQAAMLEARRRCRLLQRLKERQLEEWKAGRDRELEALASESYLARWSGSYNEMNDA